MNKVKTSIKISSLIMALLLAFSCFAMAGCGSTKTTTSTKTGAASTVAATEAAPATEAAAEKFEYNGKTTNVEIDVKDYGTIKVALYDELAPITVENFVGLVNKGFYDGLTFHRIIEGFMIQGGDPLGTGTGGSDKNIKGEFSANGVENNLSHTRGVISMARSQSFDSASSQFFIVHEDSTYLDGQYAAFGMVTDGMDVVDKVAKNTPVTDSNGTVVKSKQPVINSIKVID